MFPFLRSFFLLTTVTLFTNNMALAQGFLDGQPLGEPEQAQMQTQSESQPGSSPPLSVYGRAATGQQGNTSNRTWQDALPVATPGALSAAARGQTMRTGGQGFASGLNLPVTESGSMAILGGFTRNACGSAGNGGFKGSSGIGLFGLPPTSTGTVNLHTCD